MNFTSGAKGSTDSDSVVFNITENVIEGRVSSTLSAFEGVTVAIPLDEGYFHNAQKSHEILWQYILLVLPIGIFICGILIWSAKGKKRQAFPIVEFYPPQGVTSADVGYLIDGVVDPYDITSLLVYWANGGYVHISETTSQRFLGKKKNFIFTRLANLPNQTPKHEKMMFRDFFDCGDGTYVSTNDLKKEFYPTVFEMKKSIESSFEDKSDTRIFDKSNESCSKVLRVLAWLSLVPVNALLLNNELGVITNGTGGVLGEIGITIILALVVSLILFLSGAMVMNIFKTRVGVVNLIYLLAISSLIFGAVYLYFCTKIILLGMVSVVGMFTLLYLSNKCQKRTDLGLWYEERLKGLKEFINATEFDRIQMLVDENPSYFYHVLPFAMVLGVTDKWVKGFEHIAVPPPSWYASQYDNGHFYLNQFTSELTDCIATTNINMNITPKSSGFGGSGGSSDGGSVGGGSGGSSGESW